MRTYEVALADDGRLNWREQGPGGTVIYATEPGTCTFQRWGIRILSYLPIEWLR